MPSNPIDVFSTPEEVSRKNDADAKGKPDHWVDKQHSSFVNPWPSFRKHKTSDMISLLPHMAMNSPSIPASMESLLPIRKPTWGQSSANSDVLHDSKEQTKATWLGHACFLVELPAIAQPSSPIPSRGARILFDPVFSDRCSPSQLIGPKRFTQPPCKLEEIPEIDAIVISHNHYDHLDTTTIRHLTQRPRMPHIFAPLGNAAYFRSLGIADDKVHTLDWWESRRVDVELPAASAEGPVATRANVKASFDVTCTPAQHFTGRGLLDRFKTLWASWVVQEVAVSSPLPSSASAPPPTSGPTREGAKVFFAGDTGYRSVRDGQDEAQVPTCPAFKEIGERWGAFDLAMIPIGAYMPRDFMSPIHCAPQDSVRIFQDVRAKRAVGMHWGTWVLTSEDVLEPPRRLAEECKKVGIEEGDFCVCDIGETLFF